MLDLRRWAALACHVVFGSVQPLVCSKCGAPLDAKEGQSLLRCGYCRMTHAFVKPPPPEPEGAQWSAGERAVIEWGGRWWPGTVLRSTRLRVWLVHYDGWDARWNEEVEDSRLRHPKHQREPAKHQRLSVILALAVTLLSVVVTGVAFIVAYQRSPTTAASEHAPDYTKGATYVENEPVQLWWGSRWWNARIKQVKGSEYLVSYDGYSSHHDELVDLYRLKKRTLASAASASGSSNVETEDNALSSEPTVSAPALSAPANDAFPEASTEPAAPAPPRFSKGQAVQIEWRGRWWKGNIVQVKGGNRYLIHYDGYAKSWDEVVGPERLKAL